MAPLVRTGGSRHTGLAALPHRNIQPEDAGCYELIDWHGGKAWWQPEFPNLIFAKDGEIYDLDGKKVIVLGGAYSVDKYYRLAHDYQWFLNEQPSAEIKKFAEEQLARVNWKVDAVFSHTCPYKYRPLEAMIHGFDQSTIDTTTEEKEFLNLVPSDQELWEYKPVFQRKELSDEELELRYQKMIESEEQ